MTRKTLVNDIQSYLLRYMVFTEPDAHSFACALWAMATYLWPHFDAFPYLCIQSATKRSGKSRLAELLSYISYNAFSISGVTPATIFRLIRDKKPTLFIDEAEALGSESASMMQQVLNVGYRAGQTVPRTGEDGEVVMWPVYCPKAFIQIGDTRDTLKDRSIVVSLVRGSPQERFTMNTVKPMGGELAGKMAAWAQANQPDVIAAYAEHKGLTFLQDRDEEIWTPLFVLCELLCPDRLTELQMVAVDMATMKTKENVKYASRELMDAAERDATNAEYSDKLLRDLLSIMKGKYATNIYTHEAVAELQRIPTAPWRKFRGVGITALDIATLLEPHEVRPRPIRRGSRLDPDTTVLRGYRRVDVAKGVRGLG